MPQFLSLADGTRLAYCQYRPRRPRYDVGVIFVGGFQSDMQGTKAVYLEAHCRAQRIPFLRFDYSGHGLSSGEFRTGTLGRWIEDALAILDSVPGRQVLVGSSMGGWIMLRVAGLRPERVAGLLGLAVAPDFTEWWPLTFEQRQVLLEEGVYQDSTYTVTRLLLEEARQHLVFGEPSPAWVGRLGMPVRLIHGLQDQEVSWEWAKRLVDTLPQADVQLHLLKQAGHRLSAPDELALIGTTLQGLLKR